MLLRIYQNVDISEVKKHILIVGELEGSCDNCQSFGIPYLASECPKCHTAFKYKTNRNSFSPHQMRSLAEDQPDVLIVDYSDYKKQLAKKNAGELFK